MLEEIYRDDHLLVVNKPADLLCVPGLSSPDNLFDRAKALYPNARIVHRLDMGTSGLVIFALHYAAQKAMSSRFEKRQVAKSYAAVVNGVMASQAGEVSLPLVCDWENRPRQKVCWQTGKSALTRYKVLSADPQAERSRIALFPYTGRTHQLRVHMQSLGHTIVGDELYGKIAAGFPSRLMLHAERLEFAHPVTDEELRLTAPAPF